MLIQADPEWKVSGTRYIVGNLVNIVAVMYALDKEIKKIYQDVQKNLGAKPV